MTDDKKSEWINTEYMRAEDNKSKNEIVLSIIIPCYNNVNFTKSAIQDLLKLPSNHEVILVDNASTDTTGLIIHELMETRNKENAELKYIGCPKNLGFGRANNKGYKRAKGKNILFLNNDIKVKDNFDTWTQTLIDACQAGKLVSANGGMLDNQFNFIRETDNLIDSEYFYLSGWCLAGSRETFDKLTMNHYSDDVTDEIKEGQAWGPWNEKFFAYFEDDDLTWRAKEMGIPLDVIQVPVHHFGRMTTKKLNLASMYKTSQEIFRSLWSKKLVK